MSIVLFIVGLAGLITGAEALVRGASRLAAIFRVSPLVVGLTVVAFGTSAPELAVSIKSALSGQTGIAVGNVVGSNIFNILFILGLSALIVPLTVSQKLVRFDVPLMIGLSVILLLLSLDEVITRRDGLMLVAGLIVYIAFLLYQSRTTGTDRPKAHKVGGATSGDQPAGWTWNAGLIVGGLVLLVLGSRWLVDSAVTFAGLMGVSELIVGLTIVAAGTSLPEVVTSIIAALRGERDIAVGNVVGSNIFNIMAVLGITCIVAPNGVTVSPAAVHFDIPVMIAVALAALPVFFTGGTISRTEGIVLLGYYVAYTAYLIMAANQHDALPAFSAVMLYFVAPLTVIAIIAVTIQELRTNRRRTSE